MPSGEKNGIKQVCFNTHTHIQPGPPRPNLVKGKGSPFSITERRVPERIPVLGSHPAGDPSYKPGGRQAITFRQACSYPHSP